MAFNISFSDPQNMQISFNSGNDLNADFGSFIERETGDYEKLANRPLINEVEVIGSKNGSDYNLQNKLVAGENISLNGTVISAEFEQDFATYAEVMAFLNS